MERKNRTASGRQASASSKLRPAHQKDPSKSSVPNQDVAAKPASKRGSKSTGKRTSKLATSQDNMSSNGTMSSKGTRASQGAMSPLSSRGSMSAMGANFAQNRGHETDELSEVDKEIGYLDSLLAYENELEDIPVDEDWSWANDLGLAPEQEVRLATVLAASSQPFAIAYTSQRAEALRRQKSGESGQHQFTKFVHGDDSGISTTRSRASDHSMRSVKSHVSSSSMSSASSVSSGYACSEYVSSGAVNNPASVSKRNPSRLLETRSISSNLVGAPYAAQVQSQAAAQPQIQSQVSAQAQPQPKTQGLDATQSRGSSTQSSDPYPAAIPGVGTVYQQAANPNMQPAVFPNAMVQGQPSNMQVAMQAAIPSARVPVNAKLGVPAPAPLSVSGFYAGQGAGFAVNNQLNAKTNATVNAAANINVNGNISGAMVAGSSAVNAGLGKMGAEMTQGVATASWAALSQAQVQALAQVQANGVVSNQEPDFDDIPQPQTIAQSIAQSLGKKFVPGMSLEDMVNGPDAAFKPKEQYADINPHQPTNLAYRGNAQILEPQALVRPSARVSNQSQPQTAFQAPAQAQAQVTTQANVASATPSVVRESRQAVQANARQSNAMPAKVISAKAMTANAMSGLQGALPVAALSNYQTAGAMAQGSGANRQPTMQSQVNVPAPVQAMAQASAQNQTQAQAGTPAPVPVQVQTVVQDGVKTNPQAHVKVKAKEENAGQSTGQTLLKDGIPEMNLGMGRPVSGQASLFGNMDYVTHSGSLDLVEPQIFNPDEVALATQQPMRNQKVETEQKDEGDIDSGSASVQMSVISNKHLGDRPAAPEKNLEATASSQYAESVYQDDGGSDIVIPENPELRQLLNPDFPQITSFEQFKHVIFSCVKAQPCAFEKVTERPFQKYCLFIDKESNHFSVSLCFNGKNAISRIYSSGKSYASQCCVKALKALQGLTIAKQLSTESLVKPDSSSNTPSQVVNAHMLVQTQEQVEQIVSNFLATHAAQNNNNLSQPGAQTATVLYVGQTTAQSQSTVSAQAQNQDLAQNLAMAQVKSIAQSSVVSGQMHSVPLAAGQNLDVSATAGNQARPGYNAQVNPGQAGRNVQPGPFMQAPWFTSMPQAALAGVNQNLVTGSQIALVGIMPSLQAPATLQAQAQARASAQTTAQAQVQGVALAQAVIQSGIQSGLPSGGQLTQPQAQVQTLAQYQNQTLAPNGLNSTLAATSSVTVVAPASAQTQGQVQAPAQAALQNAEMDFDDEDDSCLKFELDEDDETLLNYKPPAIAFADVIRNLSEQLDLTMLQITDKRYQKQCLIRNQFGDILKILVFYKANGMISKVRCAGDSRLSEIFTDALIAKHLITGEDGKCMIV